MNTDNMISFAVTMFVLSLVVERIANFIKLSFHNEKVYIPILNKYISFGKLRNEGKDENNKKDEKTRELKILYINIVTGFLVALFLNADIFYLLKSINYTTGLSLGWSDFDINNYFDNIDCKEYHIMFLSILFFIISVVLLTIFFYKREQQIWHSSKKQKSNYIYILIFSIIFLLASPLVLDYISNVSFVFSRNFFGFILTGIFLSLGSKFWHDLLDILFILKNAQSKLSNPKTFTEFDSADKIQNFVSTSRYEIVDRLFSENNEKIRAIKGVLSCVLMPLKNNESKLTENTIVIEHSGDIDITELNKILEQSIEIKKIDYYLSNYCKVLYTKDITINQSNYQIKNNLPILYAKNKSNDYLGSFGVYYSKSDDKHYALSNLHVLASSAELRNKKIEKDKDVFLTFNKTSRKSLIKDSFLNRDYDYAYTIVDEKLYLEYIKIIKNEIDSKDIDLRGKLFGLGATSKLIHFKKEELKISKMVDVNYGSFRHKINLYPLKGLHKNIQGGDSGTIIYDGSTKNPIGLLVAKSDNFAYMILYNFN